MAQIRCPKCGQTDQVDLQGSYLVHCDSCGQRFTAIIVRGQPLPQVEIICPECQHSELIPLSAGAQLKISCDQCGHQFTFTHS